jgi:hypothetical protein
MSDHSVNKETRYTGTGKPVEVHRLTALRGSACVFLKNKPTGLLLSADSMLDIIVPSGKSIAQYRYMTGSTTV